MKLPHIAHTIVDRRSGSKFRVMAFRKMSKQQLDEFMRFYLVHCGKRPKRGQILTIENLED